MLDGPFEPQAAFVFSMFAIGWSSVMYRTGMPSAKREILEVDERFVTVSYDGKLMQLWGRGQLERMRLNDGAPFLGVARMRAPTIVWGSNIGGSADYAGGVGAGISREAAAKVHETIESFCAEHPAEPGFDYRGSGTMFG